MNSEQGTTGSALGNRRHALSKEAPVGYKRTEVGVLPEEWDIARIDAHASIKTGSKNTEDKQDDGDYPFFVRSQEVERITSYSYDGEAVLTAGDGVGTGKVFHYISGRFDVHQRVYRISDFSDRLNGRYFFYQFSTRFYKRIMSMTAKSSVDSVRMEMIAGMQIPLPQPVEQRAIAEALSVVDGLLAALEPLVAKKRAIKQAAMQQLLTGQTRLPGFRGAWEITSMGHIGSTYGGLSGKSKLDFGGGDTRYVTFLGVLENVVLDTNHTDHVHVAPGESQNRILKGDLLFNGTSETPGDLAMGAVMSKQIDNLYLNSFCFGFRIHDGYKYDPLFLAYFFRGSVGRAIMNALAQGATRYNLSKGQFLALRLSIAAYDEQRAIATVLSDMDAEIAALERRRDKTHAIKQGMMQQLLTGRVRLVKPE